MDSGSWGQIWTRTVAGLVMVGALASCARTVPPTGGEVPATPLRVIATSPAPFDEVEPFDGPLVFTFPRTLSERLTRGSLADAVEVSPRDGDVSVRRRGARVEVRMDGGFRRDAVYRVTLRPRFQDRFRNVQEEQVDLFFSTGAAFGPTVLAGVLIDRVTGEEIREGRVEATLGTFPEDPSEPLPGRDAPAVHAVQSDSSGVFLFRFLPPGAYSLRAFDDANRNLRPDFAERQGVTRVALGEADTLLVADFALLQPDTTPARLMEATLLDSLHLTLRFDDPLDPQGVLDEVRVALAVADPEDEILIQAQVLKILPLYVFEAQVALTRWEAARDAALADDEPWEEERPEAVDPGSILPQRQLVVQLSEPLPPDVLLSLEASGVRNLSGIPGGGGEVTFRTPAPPTSEPESRLDPPPGSGVP